MTHSCCKFEEFISLLFSFWNEINKKYERLGKKSIHNKIAIIFVFEKLKLKPKQTNEHSCDNVRGL